MDMEYDLLSRFHDRLWSGEVFGLALIGIGFSAIAALGLVGIIYYSDWKRKLACAALIPFGAVGCSIFYGWSLSGRWDGILCQCFA